MALWGLENSSATSKRTNWGRNTFCWLANESGFKVSFIWQVHTLPTFIFSTKYCVVFKSISFDFLLLVMFVRMFITNIHLSGQDSNFHLHDVVSYLWTFNMTKCCSLCMLRRSLLKLIYLNAFFLVFAHLQIVFNYKLIICLKL